MCSPVYGGPYLALTCWVFVQKIRRNRDTQYQFPSTLITSGQRLETKRAEAEVSNNLINFDTILIEVAIATGGSCEALDFLEGLLGVLYLVGGCHCRGAKLIDLCRLCFSRDQDLVFSGLVTGGRIQKGRIE